MKNYIIDPIDWLLKDPDLTTRLELENLIKLSVVDKNKNDELYDSFSENLKFGTAGLRAKMGPGPNRMNRLVVQRAALGIAIYAKKIKKEKKIKAVVGYDGRMNSETFAIDTVGVLTHAGIDCYIMPRKLPTPLLAFSVRAMNADIGIMVTASHNPHEYNGYKVYLGGGLSNKNEAGSQISHPVDKKISTCINSVNIGDIKISQKGWSIIEEDIINLYIDRIVTLIKGKEPIKNENSNLKIVYTAMHGVGSEIISQVLKKTGFTQVSHIKEQDFPDPKFPTVTFPNPEEKGALDLSFRKAEKINANIVIAHDPDADRAAVALPNQNKKWKMLSGDQVGILLCWYILSNNADPKNLTVANSIVSSRMMKSIASNFGAQYKQTLTGFKWISRVSRLTFGYEEALGYCIDPQFVLDKDGTSALLFILKIASELKKKNKTIWNLLDALYIKYGLHKTKQFSVHFSQSSEMNNIMKNIRSKKITHISNNLVIQKIDLMEDNNCFPKTNCILYLCSDNSRIIIRPSGTEPKLKCYIEVIVHPSTEKLISNLHSLANCRILNIKKDLMKNILELS